MFGKLAVFRLFGSKGRSVRPTTVAPSATPFKSMSLPGNRPANCCLQPPAATGALQQHLHAALPAVLSVPTVALSAGYQHVVQLQKSVSRRCRCRCGLCHSAANFNSGRPGLRLQRHHSPEADQSQLSPQTLQQRLIGQLRQRLAVLRVRQCRKTGCPGHQLSPAGDTQNHCFRQVHSSGAAVEARGFRPLNKAARHNCTDRNHVRQDDVRSEARHSDACGQHGDDR